MQSPDLTVREFSSDALRAARRERGMTRMELANRLGCGYGSVSQWETERRPNLRNADRLARALGCSIEDLLIEAGP
jgi:transcriptional regulator with XRE-family HTH domain